MKILIAARKNRIVLQQKIYARRNSRFSRIIAGLAIPPGAVAGLSMKRTAKWPFIERPLCFNLFYA
jgi:hypothetical protein